MLAATDSYIHESTYNEYYTISCLFRFTVHGFRYLSVFDPPNPLTIDDVECYAVHNETTLIGHFISNNPVINQIHHNIQWSQLSNLMSVPTEWSVPLIFSTKNNYSLLIFS